MSFYLLHAHPDLSSGLLSWYFDNGIELSAGDGLKMSWIEDACMKFKGDNTL